MHPANEILNIVMRNEGRNNLKAEEFIKEVIDLLPPDFSKWSIYRVPKLLLNMNPKAYIPEVVSIGPFHHGRKELMATESLKIYCLNNYVRRINLNVHKIVEVARCWESKARSCYAEPISMEREDFVKMMLVDGCFIMELLFIACEDSFVEIRNGFDLSFFKAIWFDINRDLIMLENQLPFFVLQDLFDLLPGDKNKNGISFTQIMIKYLSKELIGRHFEYNIMRFEYNISSTRVSHLIDLLSLFFISTDNEMTIVMLREEFGLGKPEKFCLPPTVSQLSEASIKVRKAKDTKSLLDISFENGVLKIPPFEINNEFEFYVRNLMAFEHLRTLEFDSNEDLERRTKNIYVLDYIQFLDGLISTEEDVALLVKEGIITNHRGGSNEEVSQMFNNLCKYTAIPHHFYYRKLSKELHDYCKKWRHRSMATLRRDYFNSPWAWISFIAATFLIFFTGVQTFFSVFSFFHN